MKPLLQVYFLLMFIATFAQVNFTSSNLPIVSINTYEEDIPADSKIQSYIRIIYNGYNTTNHPDDSANVYSGHAKIKIRGASSQSYPQKSYSFTTVDNLGADRNTEILGMPYEHDWVLINSWNEKSFCRNILSQHLFEKMGHYGVRMRLCEVLLNGEYNGVYLLGEKIKRDSNRVDVAKLKPTDISGAEVTGGYILKNDIYTGTNGWLSNYHPVGQPGKDVYILYEYPEFDEINNPQKTYIQKYVDSMETALYGSNFADPSTGYAKYLSLQSFVDYFLMNELARNVDGNKKSSYWHKEKTGKLKAGPVWDFDWAWKNIWDCSEYSNTNGSGWSYKIVDCNADVVSFGWFKRLLEDPTYANRTNCRWKELRRSVFDTTYLFHLIDSVKVDVQQAQARHFQQFPVLGTNNGAPESDAIPNSFNGEINKLKQWIRVRTNWLDQNMPGTCPVSAVQQPIQAHTTLYAYPNPSEGIFTIENLRPGYPLEVYNSCGQLVYLQESTATEITLNLNLSSGIYSVKHGKDVMKVSVR